MKTKSLIIKKPVIGAEDWSVQKYAREVFYKNLWDTDDELLESRGKVVASDGSVVALPLKKVFNYLENGAGSDLKLDDLVELIYKVNGSMFHVTLTDRGLVYGTTGSAVLGDTPTQNDFLNRGRDLFKSIVDVEKFKNATSHGVTWVFEVVDKVNDPHVVDDFDGLYLLAIRDTDTGEMFDFKRVRASSKYLNENFTLDGEYILDTLSIEVTFAVALNLVKISQHEGFMVRKVGEIDFSCKMKTPYYLNKKRAQRMSPDKVFSENWRENFDDDFYATVHKIHSDYTKESWANLDEQQRGTAFQKAYSEILGD